MNKQLKVDFLYLDLTVCERCQGTDTTLTEALNDLHGLFDTLGYEVVVNSINVSTKALAEKYRFESSPTVLVNGIDVLGEITENDCCSCGSLCGDSVDCRTFRYDGKTYEQPPKQMIIEGILKAMYGGIDIKSKKAYVMPQNLISFYEKTNKGVNTMKTMQIYEPAMCCSTGLCGVGVNPELLRISTVLDALKKNGVIVERFNLNNAPQAFIKNAAINANINANGTDNLPLTVVDGKIAVSKRYPTNDEIVSLLGVPAEFIKAPEKKQGGCSCGKNGCC